MQFKILELVRTGEYYKDKHGKTVERGTSKIVATIKAKSKAEALKQFIVCLPNEDKRKIIKDIITADDGITTQFYTIKAV